MAQTAVHRVGGGRQPGSEPYIVLDKNTSELLLSRPVSGSQVHRDSLGVATVKVTRLNPTSRCVTLVVIHSHNGSDVPRRLEV